jgi:hypothetical protein
VSSPLSITIRDLDGNVLVHDSLTLAPTQRVTAILTESFPQTADKAGILQVSTGLSGLSGLGLRFDGNGGFSVIQTLSTDSDADAPKPPSATAPGPNQGFTPTCSSLEGAMIFANDGQYLGKITSNEYDTESLGNKYGKYGSSYSSSSIFNQYGTYGSSYSALSPFNPYAATPPIIFVDGKPVAYLTVNTSKTPSLSPTMIYPCVGRR